MHDLLPTSADLQAFLPEMLLAAACAATLLAPMLQKKKNLLVLPIVTTAGLGAAWLSVTFLWRKSLWFPAAYFGGMLSLDPFSWSLKLLLIGFALIVMALWFTDSHDKFITRNQTRDMPEFFCMLVAATLGLCLMAETTNLLMLFVAIELAFFPSCVLAGFRKGHRPGEQGSLKFMLLGAAAGAVMLYGMSLLYGLFGTLDVRQMGALLADRNLHHTFAAAQAVVLGLGVVGLLAGVGFNIAVVPVHFWSADVLEGATMDVTTFFAVASASAGLSALMRNLLALTGAAGISGLGWLAAGLLGIGIATSFCGNLQALAQTNVKRFLAWFGVAHVGYVVIGMSALFSHGHNIRQNAADALLQNPAADALLFYLVMYLFMNGGAYFAAAAIAQRLTGPTDAGMSLGVDRIISLSPQRPRPVTGTGEELAQYAGLWRRAPILAVTMLVFLLSLAGTPLTIGFATRLKLFTTLFDTGAVSGWIGIAAIAINSVIGAFACFRIIRQMFLTESDGPRLIEIAPVTIIALILIVPNVLLFPIYGLIEGQTRRHSEMLGPASPASAVMMPALKEPA